MEGILSNAATAGICVDLMYAPLLDKSPALGGGSMEMKLKIRIGSVREMSEDSEPALSVARIEYSTSMRRERVTDSASGYDGKRPRKSGHENWNSGHSDDGAYR